VDDEDAAEHKKERFKKRPAEAEEKKVSVRVVEDDFPKFQTDTEHVPVKKMETTPIEKVNPALHEDKKSVPSQTEETMLPVQKKKSIFTKIREKIEYGMEWITSIPMRIHYKISEILTRILDFLADITENIRKLSQKRDEVDAKVRKLRRLLEQDSTKKAWKDIVKYIKQLFRHVRPKKFHGKVHFGMDNPATTGQVLGAVGVLMPIYKEHIVVAPDFEQQIFEGELSAKGRVQAGYIVILAIKVLLNRNLMQTITKAKSIIGGSK
jgi:hypothetical protein